MNLHRTETGAPQRNEVPRELWNIWQEIAEQTRDIVTPANLLDVAALGAEIYVNQELILGGHETMKNTQDEGEFKNGAYQKMIGLILDQPLLITDFLDGHIARATGTNSRLGEKMDFVGDFIKTIIKLRTRQQIGEMGVKELLAIGGPKIINAGTSAIRTLFGETVRPTLLAKAAEWPRGAAFLACDISEIVKTRDQIDMIESGCFSLIDAQKYPVSKGDRSSRLVIAELIRNGLLVGAAAGGLVVAGQNVITTGKHLNSQI